MKELVVGTTKKLEKIVMPEDSAMKVGSGLVDVWATPSMVALCEKTASEALLPFLDEGEVSVGCDIHLNHYAPSKIGAKVVCTAQLFEVTGKKIKFRVVVNDNGNMVGLGQHTRCIVDKNKFMSKLNKKKS